MKQNRWAIGLTWCLSLVPAAAVTLGFIDDAGPRKVAAFEPATGAGQVAPADPKHLWNRLRSRLHVRTEGEIAIGAERLALDPNEHDPLHWSRIWFPEPVDYLFKGAPYREAIAVLDEFLTKEGDKLESDPLQRALLQHDLWAAFDYVSNPDWSYPLQLKPESKRYGKERRELYLRLARAIERLALTKGQIDKLPDNYADAVAAAKYPTKFDAARLDQAYLPPDLWDAEGPWVLVGEWADNPLAIRHTAFFKGRSTFAVFLRLPEGRAATMEYLKVLREWKPPAGQQIPPNGRAIPPQVPPQTQFALARRMMVVNDAGEQVPTQLTESLQIRVLPDFAMPRHGHQTFLEFRLRRQELIDSQGGGGRGGGGISAVSEEERERSDMIDLGQRNDDEKYVFILKSCRDCHTDQGILSMNSLTGNMDNVSRLRGMRTLTDSPLKAQEDATIGWKQKQYSWGLLQGLMEGKSRD